MVRDFIQREDVNHDVMQITCGRCKEYALCFTAQESTAVVAFNKDGWRRVGGEVVCEECLVKEAIDKAEAVATVRRGE